MNQLYSHGRCVCTPAAIYGNISCEYGRYHQRNEMYPRYSYVSRAVRHPIDELRGPIDELVEASQRGELKRVEELLARGLDPNNRNYQGVTPLIAASQQGHLEIVDLLLSRGADPIRQDLYGRTALTVAAAAGYRNVVERLIRAGVDINSIDRSGDTTLMMAAGTGATDVVDALLELGADIDARNIRGSTALMMASKQENVGIVDRLLARGANVNQKDISGRSALMMAACDGVSGAIDRLIVHGANIEAEDNDGNNALMHAVLCENANAVERLLDIYPTFIEMRNNRGETPLLLMMKESYARKEDREEDDIDRGVLHILLDRGIDVNAQDKNGVTALMIASRINFINVARILVEHGANPMIPDNDGQTAVDQAVSEGMREVLQAPRRGVG